MNALRAIFLYKIFYQEDGQYTGTDPQDATPTSSLGRRQPPAQQQHRGDVEITTDGVGIQSEPKQVQVLLHEATKVCYTVFQEIFSHVIFVAIQKKK